MENSNTSKVDPSQVLQDFLLEMKEQEPAEKRVPLLELATAYSSLRDSGFDFPTAVGELIDNAIQAGASRIDIITKVEEKKHQNSQQNMSTIIQVSIIDNGFGMSETILHGCLQLGFSTRYNDRKGLGRFGVGATLAAISQCKRITIFSRTPSESALLSTYIDLDEIAAKEQIEIPLPQKLEPPNDLESLLADQQGTIVVWDKCDRLQSDPNGHPIDASVLLKELEKWISRAYRYYLWDGVKIFIDSKNVIAHDPLFLNPAGTQFPDDAAATIRFEHNEPWHIPSKPEETSNISIKLTLLSEELRPKEGSGGKEPARVRLIHENEGISVLRHKREVAFGNFWPMVPAIDPRDRWWGCEISFEPELDECWEVRNVKRGARPTTELRDVLSKLISKKIRDLRNEISTSWKKTDAKNADEKGIHFPAEEIVKEAESTMKPAVQAGRELSEEDKRRRREDIIDDPDLSPKEQSALAEKVLGPEPLPITVKSKAMTGSEFMITDHVGNSQIVVTFNKDHPFFSEIYSKLIQLEESNDDAVNTVAMQVRKAIDLLLMAYGRAESMIDLDNPTIEDAVSMLRSYWGVHLRRYINTLARKQT